MKKIFIFIFLFSFINLVYGESTDIVSNDCEYKGDFEMCYKNQSPRSIQDFICLSSTNPVEIMGQIVLDREFKKVDEKVENYINFLEKNKNYYFGSDAKESFLKGIDEVEDRFGIYSDNSYGKKYMDLCNPGKKDSILSKTLDCFSGSVSNEEAKKYFIQTDCKRLALLKLEVDKQVSYDILKLNKDQIKKDEAKKYTQKQRTKYDKLLDIIMENIGYMERLRKKWPSKTARPTNS